MEKKKRAASSARHAIEIDLFFMTFSNSSCALLCPFLKIPRPSLVGHMLSPGEKVVCWGAAILTLRVFTTTYTPGPELPM
jgi:hypothetical protein